MSKATIEINLHNHDSQFGVSWYRPSQIVSGNVTIYPEEEVKCDHLYVRLQWRTEGRGTPFLEKVEELDLFQGTLETGFSNSYDFNFQLPDSPWSYEGKYIKVVWEISVVIDVPWARDPKAAAPFSMGPDREEVSESGFDFGQESDWG